jgi:hypothetical protein
MAIPTSAAVSATASLTPSPTKTTRRPDVWSSATKAALWAGAHSARTWDGSFWLIKAKGRYKGIWNDMDMGIYPSWNLCFFWFHFRSCFVLNLLGGGCYRWYRRFVSSDVWWFYGSIFTRAKSGCCITVFEIFRYISPFEMDSLGSC